MRSNEISPAQNLCQILIRSAIWRCRISENLCRLSVTLKCLHGSDHPVTQIKVSDTGIGISLAELQGIDYTRNLPSAANWDGVVRFTTTSICDKEIYHYRLNMKETKMTRRLKRLPSTPKNVGAFSGSEVSFSTQESFEELMPWITQFCQKKVVVELQVEHADRTGSRCKHLVGPNEDILLLDSQPRHLQLSSAVKDYILRHGNALENKCQSCFSSNENPKEGYGLSCCKGKSESARETVEAVIVITEVPESSNAFCMNVCDKTTEVLYFQDFAPCSFPPSSLNAFTSIDWKNYGFTLKTSMIDREGRAILDWETLPSSSHVHIVVHKFRSKFISQTQQKIQIERSLIKKAMKIALDDLKAKCPGDFLSVRAVEVKEIDQENGDYKIKGWWQFYETYVPLKTSKVVRAWNIWIEANTCYKGNEIRRYVPDLSRSIAGLILSSNDSKFEDECASLLGLQAKDMDKQGTVESCITEKIIKVIEKNDTRLKMGRGEAPCLFEDYNADEEDDQDDEEGDHILEL